MVGILRLIMGVTALKVFLGGLFMTIIGIVMYNVITDLINEALIFTLTQMDSLDVGSGATATYTGVAAWFADKLCFQEMLAFMISMITLKWMLRKIPFMKW
jgi:hypothetical protein